MAARVPRRSFARPFVTTISMATSACFVSSSTPPSQPISQAAPGQPENSDPAPSPRLRSRAAARAAVEHDLVVLVQDRGWLRDGGQGRLPGRRDVQPAATAALRLPGEQHRAPRDDHLGRRKLPDRAAAIRVPDEPPLQSAAVAPGAVPEALARVRDEWRCRIAAEYTSAAIAQQVGLWLIQAGAPPDLIDACLAIVADELVHSRLSYDVLVAAGGSGGPALDRDGLGLARRHAVLELDLLHAIARVFCLGETIAVPLFRHLRERCTEPVARTALDRILRDEVRHRDFGWDTLDWLASVVDVTQLDLAPMLAELDGNYGAANPAVRAELAATDVERAWGLAPAAEYAEVLARTIDRDFRPRFAARGLVLT
jgi:hypothetical protein